MKKLLIAVTLMIGMVSSAVAQNPLEYLESTFPKLSKLYHDELGKFPAHYIFAVDVSGTMNKYEPVVLGSLIPFFEALPNGDYVDVIPFGVNAMPSMLGFTGKVTPETKNVLRQNVARLYNHPNYEPGFKGYTNVKSVIDATSNVIQTNRDCKINVVVVLTDFRNDVKGDSPSEHKFSKDDMEKMKKEINAATSGAYNRFVALELPVNRNAAGYCLDQLKNEVFPQEGRGLERVMIPAQNGDAAIKDWFDRLRKEIMVDKMRAVIEEANRLNPAKLIVDTDIDGNVNAEVHWTPSKLYPTIQIDSSYVGQSGFFFENNEENYTQTRDSVIGIDPKLVLGQIVYESYGFHQFNDSIHLGIKLPTEYDDELEKLGVEKPIPATTRAENRWIFTFFLPFWLTVLLIILLILYIIGVMKAIARNSKFSFKANITFLDNEGYQLDDTRRLPEQSSQVRIGKGATSRCECDGAEWQILIDKVKSNPFLVFTKPYFKWKKGSGFVMSGSSQSGKLDYSSNSSVRIKCGLSRNEITHQVKIQMKS